MIDRQSVVRNGDLATAVVRVFYLSAGETTQLSAKSQYRFDCANGRATPLAVQEFDGDGNLVNVASGSFMETDQLSAGNIEDGIRRVCRSDWSGAEPSVDIEDEVRTWRLATGR
jgi:hypothetical protein